MSIINLVYESPYQNVEYIANSWTQYIMTDLKCKDWYRIVAEIERTSNSWYATLGCYLWYINNTHYRLYAWTNWNNQFCYGFLNNYSESLWAYSLNTKYTWDVSWVSWNMYFKCDWVTKASSTSTWSVGTDSHLLIFASAWTDDTDFTPYSWAKIYSHKIYNSSWTLVRNLVPCYRKSDGEIWMYDTVTDTFYTNSWTGTFTKWPDVN